MSDSNPDFIDIPCRRSNRQIDAVIQLRVLCVYRKGQWCATTPQIPQEVHPFGGPPAIEPDHYYGITHIPIGMRAITAGDLWRAMLYVDAFAEVFTEDPFTVGPGVARQKLALVKGMVADRIAKAEAVIELQNKAPQAIGGA